MKKHLLMIILFGLTPLVANAACSEDRITTTETYSQSECWHSLTRDRDWAITDYNDYGASVDNYDLYEGSKKVRFKKSKWGDSRYKGFIQCMPDHQIHVKVCGGYGSERRELMDSLLKGAYP
ncbi:MAG: hypothetical protein R8M38_00245 [Mariprofundaceae bacterium]